MAEIVARGPGRPVAEATRIVLRPPSADGGDDFTVTETADGLAGARRPSPSAGCGRPTSATTRPSASSPTGSTGSGSRPGCVSSGAEEGDTVLIGDPDNAVVFDFKPGIDAGAEMLGRRGEDQRFEEKRPAAAAAARSTRRCDGAEGEDPRRRGAPARRGRRGPASRPLVVRDRVAGRPRSSRGE
jgi:GTP-binding protein